MHNIFIVIGREYMTRVRKRSFLILTILIPFLIVGIVTLPLLLGSVKDDKERPVAIIDTTGRYAALFTEAQKADSTRCEGYVFMKADRTLAAYNTDEAPADVVISITADLSKDPSAVRMYSRGEIQQDLLSYVEETLGRQIHADKLAAYNIPGLDNIIADLQQDINVKTIKWDAEGGETFSSGDVAMALGLVSSLLIYMFVLSYGGMVMQGVMEEKTNRIVEVIIGSVRPFDLMMGKIIGIMLVGFTQMLVWGLMLLSVSTLTTFSLTPDIAAGTQMMDSSMSVAMAEAAQSPAAEMMAALSTMPLAEIAILFVLYFLGGYVLYSSFYAAIGAAVNSQEDSAQFMMPMMIIMVFSIYAAMGSMENTDGPLAFWASMFPLTSPVVMMVRLPFGVPLWQELLSVSLLYATAILFVWISGKIYRIGVLMYGKKPTLKDMVKWMRYK
ncbi:MAG: ABC transporter permease [Prevotella sp.]